MKYLIIILSAVFAYAAVAGSDVGNNFILGDGAATINKSFKANVGSSSTKPAVRYNISTSKWEMSHDGSAYSVLNSGSGINSNGQPAGYVLTSDGSNGAAFLASAAQDSPYEVTNCSITTSVASNALTIALKGNDGNNPSGSNICKIAFRNSSLTSGQYSQVLATAATSLVISSGSTLGTSSAALGKLYVYAVNNSGTIELGVVGQKEIVETDLQSSTAEGGAGAADSAGVLYSTTARTSKAIRLIARIDITETVAGTWATNASQISPLPLRLVSKPTYAAKFTCGAGQADANTLTLLTFDSSPVKNYAPGSPPDWSLTDTISTSTKQFGAGALSQTNGTQNSANTPGSSFVNLGSGDFTVDFWIFSAGSGTLSGNGGIFGNWAVNAPGAIIFNWTGAVFTFYNGSSNTFTPTSLPQNGVWNHIALVRSGSTDTLYTNGVAATSTISDSVDYSTIGLANTFTVGSANGAGNSGPWFIDEFRMSNVARWTTNFTPPAAAYSITNTISSDEDSILSEVDGGATTGQCLLNFTPAKFSSEPICTCNVVNATIGENSCQWVGANSTSTGTMQTRVNGAAANTPVYMICR